MGLRDMLKSWIAEALSISKDELTEEKFHEMREKSRYKKFASSSQYGGYQEEYLISESEEQLEEIDAEVNYFLSSFLKDDKELAQELTK